MLQIISLIQPIMCFKLFHVFSLSCDSDYFTYLEINLHITFFRQGSLEVTYGFDLTDPSAAELNQFTNLAISSSNFTDAEIIDLPEIDYRITPENEEPRICKL